MKIDKIKTLAHYIKNFEYYPLILATFPILSLYSHNINHVHYASILRFLIINVAITFIISILLNLIIKKNQNAALITSIVILLVYSYGHVFNYIESFWPGIRHRYLSIVWIILIFLSLVFISKAKNIAPFSKIFTIFSVSLLIIPGFQITQFQLEKYQANRINQQINPEIQNDLSIDYLPDIYYIILDAYTRSDVLLNKYDFDNSEFLDQLEKMGFFIGSCSQANFKGTDLSLTSSLNMDYLQTLFPDFEVFPDWGSSAVKQKLNSLGYKTVAFDSRGIRLNNQDIQPDILIKGKQNDLSRYEKGYLYTTFNDFELELLRTTWINPLLLKLSNYLNDSPGNLFYTIDDSVKPAYVGHYREIQYTLDEIENIPQLDSPKFVYIHLLIPHEPYVFSADGEFEYHDGYNEYKLGYTSNIAYVNSRITQIVDSIIDRSFSPPIIIIQGDHGRNGDSPKNLMPILNAYYLPNGGDQNLYESISPVNTFRVIFNTYFNSSYPILEDVSYYSDSEELTDYRVVPNNCEANLD